MSSKKKGPDLHREILDAAWDLVSQKGAEISMAQIAKAVGVSRQAIYLHFGSRGGLLMALVKRADERFTIKEDYLAAIEIPDGKERLDQCLHVWFMFVRKIRPVARDLIRLRATDPDAKAAWEDRMADLRSWIHKLTQSLQNDGLLAENWDASLAADYIWVTSSIQTWDIYISECHWPEEQAEIVLRQSIASVLFNAHDIG